MDTPSLEFLSVIEVFPPLFPFGSSEKGHIDLEGGIEQFVEGVREIRDLGDVFLVADVKNPGLAKLSTVEASFLLQQRLQVKAAPVIVVRDMNRLQFLSMVLTAISLDLDSMMIAWGDDYPASARAANVRDFTSLREAIIQASELIGRAGSSIRLFAPVDLNGLATPRGVDLAKHRLGAGADFLLAQPPTTDSGRTFGHHASLLEGSDLKGRVLLNVFPFRNEKDIKDCERYFGWRLPKSLHQAAGSGEASLIKEEKKVIRRLRAEKFPGVYLTTRGTPAVAGQLLS